MNSIVAESFSSQNNLHILTISDDLKVNLSKMNFAENPDKN
jgi:hypothetical protein